MNALVPLTSLTVGGIAAAGSVVSVGFYIVHKLTRPQAPTFGDINSFTPFEFAVPFELVSIPTSKGGRLQGWFVLHSTERPVIVVCPGYRGRKGDLLGISMYLWRAGYNVLLFDYCGHGAHSGTPVTLGYQEVEDFLAVVGYVRSRLPEAHIGALGYSMGAAVAIMGAARLPEIEVVVSDSSFATHRGVLDFTIRRTVHAPYLPTRPFLWVADHLMQLRAGYRFRDVEPLRDIVKLAPRPVLLIHAKGDSMIDYHDAERLFAAASGPKELWIAPGKDHCGTYFLDRAAYCERVAGFFHKYLAHQNAASTATPYLAPAV